MVRRRIAYSNQGRPRNSSRKPIAIDLRIDSLPFRGDSCIISFFSMAPARGRYQLFERNEWNPRMRLDFFNLNAEINGGDIPWNSMQVGKGIPKKMCANFPLEWLDRPVPSVEIFADSRMVAMETDEEVVLFSSLRFSSWWAKASSKGLTLSMKMKRNT